MGKRHSTHKPEPPGREAQEAAPRQPTSSQWRERIGDIHFLRYEWREEILEAFFRFALEWTQKEVTVSEIAEGFLDPVPEFKTEQEAYKAVLKAVDNMGVWAFCDPRAEPPTIHYWRKHDCLTDVQSACYGYQLTQLGIVPFLQAGPVDVDVLGEMVGAIAARAFRIAFGDERPPTYEPPVII